MRTLSDKLTCYSQIVGLRGILAVIKAKATGNPVVSRVTKPQVKHPVYLRVPTSDVSAYKQIFMDREYDFDVRKTPKVIIDAGANIGLAAIYFANRFPDAKVLAIEPEDSNFVVLEKNAAAYPNIVLIHGALWSQTKELDLVDPGLGKWGFMTQSGDSGEKDLGQKCHLVNGYTVDQILETYGLDRIDIFIMDIEGAEREVFGDSPKWVENVDSFIVELHERMKPGCEKSVDDAVGGFVERWTVGENHYFTRAGGCVCQRHK